MRRLKVVLLAGAVGVAMVAVVWSPGMTQQTQPSSVTPASYQGVAYAPASDTQNIRADAAPVALRTAAGQGQSAGAMDCAALAARDFSTLPDARVEITSASDVAATATDPAYCEVAGTVASNAQFVLQLPSTGWTGHASFSEQSPFSKVTFVRE